MPHPSHGWDPESRIHKIQCLGENNTKSTQRKHLPKGLVRKFIFYIYSREFYSAVSRCVLMDGFKLTKLRQITNVFWQCNPPSNTYGRTCPITSVFQEGFRKR